MAGRVQTGRKPLLLSESALVAITELLSNAFTLRGFENLARVRGQQFVRKSTKYASILETLRTIQSAEWGCFTVLVLMLAACSPENWNEYNRNRYLPLIEAVTRTLGNLGVEIDPSGALRVLGQSPMKCPDSKESLEADFDAHGFHESIVRHGRDRFVSRDWAGAVFQSCTAFASEVRHRISSTESGMPLMEEAFDETKGKLRVSCSIEENQKNEQRGVKHLAIGLMSGARNPLGHTPALEWPLSRSEALELLGVASFLFRKLDTAVKVQ